MLLLVLLLLLVAVMVVVMTLVVAPIHHRSNPPVISYRHETDAENGEEIEMKYQKQIIPYLDAHLSRSVAVSSL